MPLLFVPSLSFSSVRTRCTPQCKTRPPNKSPRRGASRGRAPARFDPSARNELTDAFEEDVKSTILPGARKKKDTADSAKALTDMFKKVQLPDLSNMSRQQTLDLLVRGAWIGIGVLVGYFFVIHFVIVGDLLPGHTPPAPPS